MPGGGYVQIDETPIEYLVPGNGETKLGYLWACARPGGDTVFTWHTSRAAACLESIIPSGFRGTVQCDAYAAYPAFVRSHNATAGSEAITLAGCWAHARRGFIEARESAPRTVGWLLRQIAALYQIEAHLRACRAGPNLREAVRAAHSIPLARRIGAASSHAISRKARWAKPSPTPRNNGPRSNASWATDASRSTTTW